MLLSREWGEGRNGERTPFLAPQCVTTDKGVTHKVFSFPKADFRSLTLEEAVGLFIFTVILRINNSRGVSVFQPSEVANMVRSNSIEGMGIYYYSVVNL